MHRKTLATYALSPHSAPDDRIMAMMRPKRPRTEPKISIIKTLTNSFSLAASAKAAEEPTMPTQMPQIRFETPTQKSVRGFG